MDTFRKDGRVRFYRSEAAVDEQTAAASALARGGPPAARTAASRPGAAARTTSAHSTSGIAGSCWRCGSGSRPSTGRPWLDAIASQLHISEFILYGVFVDGVLGASAQVIPEDSMLCHSHWGPEPMADATVPDFVGSLQPDDVAVMISAQSDTEPDVRRRALSGVRSTVALGS